MNRAALISSVLFAAVALQAQDVSKKSRGIRFPPDLEAPTSPSKARPETSRLFRDQ